MSKPKSLSFLSLTIFSISCTAVADIHLHYNTRPPYLVPKDDTLTGLTGGPAIAAFKAAGFAYTISATPSERQIYLIKENAGPECGIGWFKNPEREVYAKFSKAIYQDEPQIGLIAGTSTKLKNGDRLETVLGDKSLLLLVKKGYSYGKTLDALMEKLQPNRVVVTQENLTMVQMILAGRADYMFMAPEEADGVIAQAGLKAQDIRKVGFLDAPQGESRYIMCSKLVPDEVINKLNVHIK